MPGHDGGFRCCRVCSRQTATASTAQQKAVRFRRIPDSDPCATEGARYEGEDLHPSHARSRYLCGQHDTRHRRLAARGAPVVVADIAPDALPAERACAVCARLLVNQRGGLEYEQVADVCCAQFCAHCAGESFVSSLQSGMRCSQCDNEVRSWTVRARGSEPARSVHVPAVLPRQREMHDAARSGDVGWAAAPLAGEASAGVSAPCTERDRLQAENDELQAEATLRKRRLKKLRQQRDELRAENTELRDKKRRKPRGKELKTGDKGNPPPTNSRPLPPRGAGATATVDSVEAFVAPVSAKFLLSDKGHRTNPQRLLREGAKYVMLNVNGQECWVAGEAVVHQGVLDMLQHGATGMRHDDAVAFLRRVRGGGIVSLPEKATVVAVSGGVGGHGLASMQATGLLYLGENALDKRHAVSAAEMERHGFVPDPRTRQAFQYMTKVDREVDALASTPQLAAARQRPDESEAGPAANAKLSKLIRFEWARDPRLNARKAVGKRGDAKHVGAKLGHYLLLAAKWGPGMKPIHTWRRGQKIAQLTVGRFEKRALVAKRTVVGRKKPTACGRA